MALALVQQNLEKTETDPQREYISGAAGVYSRAFRSLPLDAEKIVTDFNWKCAGEMVADPEVHAAVEELVNSILPDEIQVLPGVAESDSRYDAALERAEFVAKSLEGLKRSLSKTLRILVRNAIVGGTGVAEQVYRVEEGRLVLDRLKVKTHRQVAFVVDEYDNVLGMVGKIGGGSAPGAVVSSLSVVSIDQIIAREKFLVVQFYQDSEDPRALSLLRSVYRAFKDKQDTLRQFWVWRRAVAIRSVIGILPQNAKDEPVWENGAVKRDSEGKVVMQSAADAMLSRIVTMQSNEHTAAVFPNGADVKEIKADGTGEQFTRNLKFQNAEIRTGILLQPLATGESEHQSRAATSSHDSILENYESSLRNMLEETLRKELAAPLCFYNFDDDRDLVPVIALRDVENRDVASEVQAFSRAGYRIALEHEAEIDARLGLTRRSENSVRVSDKNSSSANDTEDGEEETNQ